MNDYTVARGWVDAAKRCRTWVVSDGRARYELVRLAQAEELARVLNQQNAPKEQTDGV